jgi:hypothetical protein
VTSASARGVTRHEQDIAVAASVVAKWLHLAAAPTFAVMALLTHVFDNGVPNALCSATGSLWLGGMAPMYLLMAAFHLGPWLRLISRPRDSFSRSRTSWVRRPMRLTHPLLRESESKGELR